jgi:hypothetical protein
MEEVDLKVDDEIKEVSEENPKKEKLLNLDDIHYEMAKLKVELKTELYKDEKGQLLIERKNQLLKRLYTISHNLKSKKNIEEFLIDKKDYISDTFQFGYSIKNYNKKVLFFLIKILGPLFLICFLVVLFQIMEYIEALKIDKRNYFQYYLSLLKKRNVLIFTFFTKNDYNSRYIKICTFFFSFALYFTINAFFFNDATMHKIYKDQGNFDFIYQIPQILYSLIISAIINYIITALSLSEKNIISIKRMNELKKEIIPAKKKLLLNKFIAFFIIIYLLCFLFWYYLSCFCAVYKNTQIILIKDTIIGFCLSFIYPLFICLIPVGFRMLSLKKENRKILYIISQIAQFL